MKKLIEYTNILRSKNAGPLYITFDLIFPDKESLNYVAERLDKSEIARVYDTKAENIDIIRFDTVNSIKITFPRKYISGSSLDNDIYGCQQHMPLAEIEI